MTNNKFIKYTPKNKRRIHADMISITKTQMSIESDYVNGTGIDIYFSEDGKQMGFKTHDTGHFSITGNYEHRKTFFFTQEEIKEKMKPFRGKHKPVFKNGLYVITKKEGI